MKRQKPPKTKSSLRAGSVLPKQQPHPIVHVNLRGGFANQMMEYLVACRIAAEVEGCRISNVALPEWNINHPTLPMSSGQTLNISGNAVDVERIIGLLSAREISQVNLNWYLQWFSNFPAAEVCRDIFAANEDEYPGYGSDYLVCNIRGGEILDARHEHYTLLPVEFYADLAMATGLNLVFLGQIGDNAYCRALCERFPGAIFRQSQGALADFQTFRNSKNLVPAISTFSWLASWLSRAEMILFPVNGLFHPVQCPEIDLLPSDDKRYRFYLFPINYSVPVDLFEKAHHPLQGRWRYMPREAISRLRHATPRWPRRLDRFLSVFDETFYVQAYPDITGDIDGNFGALTHFVNHGFRENRLCFDFDNHWYSIEYPLAAVEVGQGDYLDLRHHYVEVGVMRGYSPVPPSPRIRWPRRVKQFLSVFDELYYRQAYPDVAKGTEAQQLSARDHYINHGFTEQRPCFALDEEWYSTEYPLAKFEVEQGHYVDYTHHYAQAGATRGYKPVPPGPRIRWPRSAKQFLSVFDGLYYRQAYPDVARGVEANGFTARDHYVTHGFREQRLCFDLDEEWYSAEYPLAKFEVEQGHYVDYRHHYAHVGAIREYKPVPPDSRLRWPRRVQQFLSVFDELYYEQAYPDIARGVAAKQLSARDHYATHGFREQRLCFDLDEQWYGTEYPLAKFEVDQGHYADYRHHYVEAGVIRGYNPVPSTPRVRWPRRLESFLSVFDELYYRQVYPDIARGVDAKQLLARDHYVTHGFREQRLCFPLDEEWYSTEYPLAKFEVEQRHYFDFKHHYAQVGAMRGYRPVPHIPHTGKGNEDRTMLLGQPVECEL